MRRNMCYMQMSRLYLFDCESGGEIWLEMFISQILHFIKQNGRKMYPDYALLLFLLLGKTKKRKKKENASSTSPYIELSNDERWKTPQHPITSPFSTYKTLEICFCYLQKLAISYFAIERSSLIPPPCLDWSHGGTKTQNWTMGRHTV